MTESPTPEPETPEYAARWSRGLVAVRVRSVIQAVLLVPMVRFLSPVRVLGRENLDAVDHPVVFIANHQSHMDTPVLLTALGGRLRRRLQVAAAADYFYKNRLSGAVVSLALGTVPFVRQKGSSRRSLDQLKELLGEGWSVLIFPAGTRSEGGGFKKGFTFLAVDAGCLVVPLCLHGLKEALPKGSFVPMPAGVVVGVGKPIFPGSDYDALLEAAEKAFAELAQTVENETGGWGSAGGETNEDG